MDIFGNFGKLKGDKKMRRVSQKFDNDFQYQDITMEAQARLEDVDEVRPFPYFKIFVILLFAILAGKLFYLQVTQAKENQSLAEGNRIRPRSISSSRGVITDSNGVWLARNKPSFALGVYPSDLPRKTAEREEFYKKLSEISGVSVDDIRKKVEANGYTSIELTIIKSDLPREEALVLEEKTLGMAGVVIDKRAIREYKSDSGLAHILGYTGLISESELEKNSSYLISEDFGKAGIEREYQSELRGEPGVEQVEVDSKGKIVSVLSGEERTDPVAGNNVVLNIDYALQSKMSEALQSGITTAGGDVNSGVAIAMNPQTGAVLGMVSLPSYDNNIFEGKLNNDEYNKLLNDSSLPLLNRATQGVYPSGSVIKIVMAAAGLQEGVITKNTSIETPEAITIGTWNFPDWKHHTGMTNVVRAIAESNNIFFYANAGGYSSIKGLGVNNIDKYLNLFGFVRKT